MTYPLVHPQDDGVRPAGGKRECFYCKQPVGQPHGPECVIVTKRIKVAFTIAVEMDVPHHWTVDDIEFHYNDGTWCADGVIDRIEDYQKRLQQNGQCLCNDVVCEFLEVTDATPTRKLKEEAMN